MEVVIVFSFLIANGVHINMGEYGESVTNNLTWVSVLGHESCYCFVLYILGG